MHKQTNYMQGKTGGLRVAKGGVVAGMVMLCFAAICLTAFHLHVYAISNSGTGSATSGPSSGPVGTTVSVTGTGWSEADGTQASLGYMTNSNSTCSIVADSQNGTLNGGSFNGWFRWPAGTALGTYTVCASVASTIGIAGSFTVLSTMPPQVSVSPGTLIEKQQATITATNYFPQGTAVNFYWVSQSNQVEFGIPGTTSDSNGVATVNFIVPITSMASGTYMMEAITGSQQQPTLISSVNFTYNAPAVQPSPTPSATPSPATSPTPISTADPTPSNTPTVQASATAAGTTPTPVVTQSTGGNSTPTTNTGSNGDTTNSSGTLFLIAGVAGTLFLLITIVIIALIVRRRGSRSIASLAPPRAMPPFTPGGAEPLPWSRHQGVFMNNGSMSPNGFNANPGGNGTYPPNGPRQGPGIFTPQTNNASLTNISTQAASPGNNFQTVGPPPLIPSQKSPVPSSVGVFQGQGGNPMIPISLDPTLEALRRQAQTGLFAPPRRRLDEISTK